MNKGFANNLSQYTMFTKAQVHENVADLDLNYCYASITSIQVLPEMIITLVIISNIDLLSPGGSKKKHLTRFYLHRKVKVGQTDTLGTRKSHGKGFSCAARGPVSLS